MEKRIFISHSSKDHAVAEVICNALEANGVKCWIAPRDIPYGSAWAGEISKAISNSSAFLFLSSEKSNASEQVSREIQLAIENSLTIIPIMLDDSKYSDANKYYLATIHCMIEYDAAKIHKLVEDILKTLPSEDGAEEEGESKEKKDKKPRKKRHILTLFLSVIGSLLMVALGLYLILFTDLSEIFRYISAAILGILGLATVFICYRRASKSYSVSKLKINVLLVAFFVCAAGIIFGGIKLEESLWRQDIDSKYHIVVEAPIEMTAEDFSEAVGILSERLGILCKGERYVFELQGNKVDIIIPRELFKDCSPEDVLRSYLTRAMELTLTTPTVYFGESNSEYPDYINVEPSDIESISVEFGKVQGADPSEYGITDEEYEYFKIVFDSDFCKENAKIIEHYGDKLVLAQDKAENTSYYYHNLYKSGESNTYYFINADKLENLSELLIHNYTSEPMDGSLLFSVMLAPELEDVSKISNPGKKQCNADELSDGTVTFLYEPLFDDTGEGEWSDVKTALKRRLDIIGSDYAFGIEHGEENTAIVRCSPEKMGIHIMDLLATNSFAIQGDYSYVSLMASEKDVKVVKNNGNVSFVYTPRYEDVKNKISFLSDLSAKEGDGYLYLVSVECDNLPVLRGKINKNGDVVFDEIALGVNQKLNADNSFVAELCYDILKNALKTTFKFVNYEMDDGFEIDSFGFSENEPDIEEKIKGICKEADVGFSKGSINIQCHMQVDQNLPSEMIKIAKEIFEIVNLEKSGYHQIAIYFIDEIDEERARIFFVKMPKTYYADADFYKNGYIMTHGIFSGGRLERDKEYFLELAYKDEFLKQYIHDKDGMKAFE